MELAQNDIKNKVMLFKIRFKLKCNLTISNLSVILRHAVSSGKEIH